MAINRKNNKVNNKIRVTCTIPSLTLGGAERNIVRMANSLADRGYDVSLICLESNKSNFYRVGNKIRTIYANLEQPPKKLLPNIVFQRKIKAAIKETNPDIVISFLDTMNVRVLLALQNSGIPVVVSERNNPLRRNLRLYWKFLRWLLYPTAAKVVMLAEDAQKWARSHLPQWSVTSIPNPVIIPPHVNPFKKLPCMGVQNVIAMGRLVEQKGFDLLIDAFHQLSSIYLDWNLVIIGEGPLRRSLEKQIKMLGLSDRIALPGVFRNPFDILRTADLFVFSSRWEGFGMALAEALACGLPAVSFDCPYGPRRIIKNGVDGILVAPEDVKALSESMSFLMKNEDLRMQMAIRAPEVTERFDLGCIIDSWENLIKEVL